MRENSISVKKKNFGAVLMEYVVDTLFSSYLVAIVVQVIHFPALVCASQWQLLFGTCHYFNISFYERV